MEYALGVVTGFVVAIALGSFMIGADHDECTRKFNVYACEKHVEWRPVQSKN